jgi:predicted PurR-regulated permease PerM
MTVKLKSLSIEDRVSYFAMLIGLVLVAVLKLATPLITVFLSMLVLKTLCWRGRKWLSILLFLVLVAGLFSGFVYFLKEASKEIPKLVETTVDYARAHNLDLPFTDMESLKNLVEENVKGALSSLSNFAKLASKEFVLLLAGFIIAIAFFLHPTLDSEGDPDEPNLYTQITEAIFRRLRSFYESFKQVMYAQFTISAINTTLTAIFVIAGSLKYAGMVVALTFVFGLLPIIGNIISNSLIVAIALTVSPRLAFTALIFLVVIHKLEYVLNSKIIGDRIRNPMWLTLLGLILGEHLMGIPGIILAPVVLSFLKKEASQIPAVD